MINDEKIIIKIYAELKNKLKKICGKYLSRERDLPNFLIAIAYTILYYMIYFHYYLLTYLP